MTTLRITLAGSPPRTKKNHATIVRMGKHQRPALIPSEAYQQWFKDVLTLKPVIQAQLAGKLPIEGPVSIAAAVYRDAERGDWTGYVDAIADAIQTSTWQCPESACKSKVTLPLKPMRCPTCGRGFMAAKETRKGLGLILDDSQIVHWDGTRLLKDSARPRVELTITIIPDPQKGLFPSC
jgi:hypothetical protein